MELVTLTPDIRKYFGMSSAHITFENKDIMIMMQQMNDETVIFSCSFCNLESGQKIKIEFPSLYGKCEIEAVISEIKKELFYIIECAVKSHNKNDFFTEFYNYMMDLINQKKRKEERIFCNKKNLERLHLMGTFNLIYKYRNFKAVIKDISYSGVKVLTNPVFLQAKDMEEKFSFNLKFIEPEEKYMFINSRIIRKQSFEFEGYSFAEIVLSLDENINFRKRLDSFFHEFKSIYHR